MFVFCEPVREDSEARLLTPSRKNIYQGGDAHESYRNSTHNKDGSRRKEGRVQNESLNKVQLFNKHR